jgi:hypothetical protein
MAHVWVVEMQVDGKWLPCADAFLSREVAQDTVEWKRKWKYRSYSAFRVRKYSRHEGGAK